MSTDEKERWITLPNGVHCLIKKGKVAEGPDHLIGLTREQLTNGHEAEITDVGAKSLEADLKANNGNHLKAARDHYRREFQGKHVVARIDGKNAKVTFIGSGWHEIRNDMAANPAKAKLVPHLAEIIKNGKSTPFVPAKHPPYSGFYYFYKDVEIDGRSIRAVVDVGKRADGSYEYNPYNLNYEGFRTFAAKAAYIEGKTGKKITADTFNYDPVHVLIMGGESYLPLKNNISKDPEIVHIGFDDEDDEDAMNNIITFEAASKRRIDDNGFMHVESSHITKEQVVPYRGREIPGWEEQGLAPDGIYYGYRPGQELARAVNTFNGLPIMLMHHTVSADDPKKEYQVGSMGTDAVWNAPYIDNSMIFTDAVGIRCVENGTCRAISCAYQYDPDFTPGVFEGKPYDFVMRNIRGNHVAIVEEGRAGPDVVVADSSENLKPKGVEKLMGILKDFFRGAQDSDPGIEAAENGTGGERMDITTDEDKDAKIQQLVGQFADILSEEDLKKFEDSLSDLAYSDATGESEIARKMDGEDDGLNPAEAYAYGEKREREETEGGKDSDMAEEMAASERDKLLRERAEDALKECGMDAEPDAVKEAFAKGFAWGMRDGEKDMRNPVERAKLDREHEREAMEKRLAHDAAMIRRVEDSLKSKFAAAREVEKSVGLIDPLAFDSADAIYGYALDQIGRPGVNRAAAREVFRSIVDTHRQTIAQDAAPFAGSRKFAGSFAGLSNLKIER